MDLTEVSRKVETLAPAAFRIQQKLRPIVADQVERGEREPEVFWQPDEGKLFWFDGWSPGPGHSLRKVSEAFDSPRQIDLSRMLVPIKLLDRDPVVRYIAWTGLKKSAGILTSPLSSALAGALIGSVVKGLEYKMVGKRFGMDLPFRETAPIGALVGATFAGVPHWLWNMVVMGYDPLTALVVSGNKVSKRRKKKRKKSASVKEAYIKTPLNLSELRAPIPSIHVDRLNMRIMADPLLTPDEKARVMGIASGAMTMRRIEEGGERKRPVVSVGDIARIGMAMGSGYIKGKLLGKALHFIAGVPKPVADRLAQAGLIGGLVRGIVREM